MKINREEFLKCPSVVKQGLASNEVSEQTTHFAFKNGEVFTYNDQISVNCEFNTGLESAAIQAKAFYAMLQKMTSEEIELSINRGMITISAGRAKAKISVEEKVKLPEIPIPEDWEDLPDNFNEVVKFCLFSAGRNFVKEALTCLSVNEEHVLSCDDHRITKMELKSKMKPFLIPASSAEHLIKYKPVEYALSKSWLHFQNDDGVLFNCRRVLKDYPEVDFLFDVEGDEINLPDDLRESISRAEVLLDTEFDQDKIISLDLDDGILLCRGEGSIGWFEEEIEIDYKGTAKLHIHPDHFVDILSYLKCATLGKNSLLFEGDDFKHVVSLISAKKKKK